MLFSGTGCVFGTLILSVSGILGQTKHMCVLKGSSVDLPCSVNSPDGQSTRRIDEVRANHANIYQCTDSTDTSSISLHVTDLQVKVILGPLREGQGVILNCSTRCPLTDSHTYMWYKNGQFLYEDSSPWYKLLDNSEEEVIYFCAVKGHEALKAPNVTVDSLNPSCFRMTYAGGEMCPKSLMNNPCSITYFRDLNVKVKTLTSRTAILACSTSCTVTDPKPTFLWYRYRDYNGTGQQHNVPRSLDDSYYCVVQGQEDLRSPSVCVEGTSCWRVNYMKQRICALIGSSVDISCYYSHPTGHQLVDAFWSTSSDQTNPNKLMEVPHYVGRVEFSNKLNHHTLTIKNLTVNDSAEYKIRIHTNQEGGKYGGYPGVTLFVTGLKLKMIPTADATEGQRVTLVCSSSCPLTDNPTYMWYQNRQVVTQKQSQQNYVVLDPVSSQHAGEYSCAVKGQEELRSPEETLTVTSVKNAAIVITVVCLSLVFLLLACLWIRKKKTHNSSTDQAQSRQTKSDPMYDRAVSKTLVTAPHGESTEPQDELHYSSVHFPRSTNHEVSLYSNTQPPQRQEDVQYAAVNFKTSSK